MFLVMVLPVADYYKGGLKPVNAVVVDDYDRAAPRGVGSAKVAGNYAADLKPNMRAKKEGYSVGLYLDAKTNSFVEEFSTSNFLAIDKHGAYVTPKSPTILASVTNKSLMDIATDEGWLNSIPRFWSTKLSFVKDLMCKFARFPCLSSWEGHFPRSQHAEQLWLSLL